MKNENHSSYEQGKMHSSFYILHSSFNLILHSTFFILHSSFWQSRHSTPLALRRGVGGEAKKGAL